MAKLFQSIIIIITAKCSSCSIDGISYMDPLDFRRAGPPGSDPCNPLYWYPRQIPEHCYTKIPEVPQTLHPPPVSLPVPFPPFIPIMLPLSPMPPAVPMIPASLPSLPYGVPIAKSSIIPAPIPHPFPYVNPSVLNPVLPPAGIRYPPPLSPYPVRRQLGMVPGLPGIVSPDGGINILPFSDAYSDMLERHKNKLIRQRMKSIIKDYEDFPSRRNIKKRGRYRKIKYHVKHD